MKRIIEIEIGGKTLKLRPDFVALAHLEERVDLSIIDIQAAIVSGRPKLSLMIQLIYSGMVGAEDDSFKFKELGNFLLENKFHDNQKAMDGVVAFVSEIMYAGSDSPEAKKKEVEPASVNTSSSSASATTG